MKKSTCPSAQSIVLADNNLEGVQRHNTGGRNLRVFYVFVLNKRGKPLMPTTPRKARILLKENKAIVTKRTPFTIKLIQPGGETKQYIKLGIKVSFNEHLMHKRMLFSTLMATNTYVWQEEAPILYVLYIYNCGYFIFDDFGEKDLFQKCLSISMKSGDTLLSALHREFNLLIKN